MKGMGLTVTTDHAVIGALLESVVAADPVRGTLLGTIRLTLQDTAWAASEDNRVAVRSAAQWPLAVHGDWSPDALAELAALLAPVPHLRGVSGVPSVLDPLVQLMGADRRVSRTDQRLFRLEEYEAPVGVAGTPRRATDGDRAVIREWFAAFAAEAGDPVRRPDDVADRALDDRCCWLWCDGAGAHRSLAARRPVVAGSARIGPVYTPPAQRGHGYGSAVTAAATRDILEDGGIPVLFTDLANPTSNKIYQLLGYRPVEDRVTVTFD